MFKTFVPLRSGRAPYLAHALNQPLSSKLQ